MVDASAVPISGPKLDNRRVVAALIDLAIVGAVAAAIFAAAGALGGSVSEIGLPLTLVVLGWALYYYFACESGAGQTVGKRVMKIRVVRADGSPAGMREVALRTVLRIIDMQLVYLVGLIVMLATGERRGRLGDLVGDTMIVSAEEPAAAKPAAVEAAAALRIPIGESGPAFEPVSDEPERVEVPAAVEEPEAVEEPATVEEPAAVEEPVEEEGEVADLASPSLQELASDVAAASGSEAEADADADAEAEPVAEAEAEAEAEREPEADAEPSEAVIEIDSAPSVAEALDEALAEAPEEEPAPEAERTAEADRDDEDEERVDVKSVETISAIDLVMEDSARER